MNNFKKMIKYSNSFLLLSDSWKFYMTVIQSNKFNKVEVDISTQNSRDIINHATQFYFAFAKDYLEIFSD